ncbi:MAG: imidazole glycerol phosphate synthase subunit HisH [Kofleriaceae bacterium]
MIAIVDVCSGNLRSVERALARAGGDVKVTRDPEVVRRADKIVVPGQGAFGVFMRGLVEHDLGDVLREAIASGRPYLGICLGLLRGKVVRLRPTDPRLKVPHMGWNRVVQRHPEQPEPLLANVADEAHVYFVHSFHAVPEDPSLVALEAHHGIPITAAIRKDNLFACQFHPEKSQQVGLQILRNFVEAA